MKTETHKLPAILVLFCCGISVFPATAQDLNVCPGLTIGAPGGPTIAVYSNCTVESMGTPGFHIFLGFNGNLVAVEGGQAETYVPRPTGDVPLGALNGADLVVENMGPSYSGDCTDMSSPNPTLRTTVPAVNGDVYCARATTTDNNQAYIRGRLSITGTPAADGDVPSSAGALVDISVSDGNWSDPLFLNNVPGLLAPAGPSGSTTPSPVPVMPPLVVLLLATLIGVFGRRARS